MPVPLEKVQSRERWDVGKGEGTEKWVVAPY